MLILEQVRLVKVSFARRVRKGTRMGHCRVRAPHSGQKQERTSHQIIFNNPRSSIQLGSAPNYLDIITPISPRVSPIYWVSPRIHRFVSPRVSPCVSPPVSHMYTHLYPMCITLTQSHQLVHVYPHVNPTCITLTQSHQLVHVQPQYFGSALGSPGLFPHVYPQVYLTCITLTQSHQLVHVQPQYFGSALESTGVSQHVSPPVSPRGDTCVSHVYYLDTVTPISPRVSPREPHVYYLYIVTPISPRVAPIFWVSPRIHRFVSGWNSC